MRAFFVAAAACGAVCLSSIARADDPVVVEYVAPPECASSDAFHALLQAQIARTPNPDRPWRFSVTIRHDGDYVGTLKTESGVRELRAPSCDDVTAALSLVIAMAQPELPAPTPPPPQPPPTLPLTPPLALAPPTAPAHDSAEPTTNDQAPQWRLGVRGEHWGDGSQLDFNGAFITAGVEVPWGFPKMHFELGAGAMYFHPGYATAYPLGTSPYPNGDVMLGMLDAQACPLDLPIGSTGLDVLGCARIAFGVTKGVLTNGDYGLGGWGGGGGRVRWQSPWRVYVEAHLDGLYGTRVEGVPALMDFGGSIGLRI